MKRIVGEVSRLRSANRIGRPYRKLVSRDNAPGEQQCESCKQTSIGPASRAGSATGFYPPTHQWYYSKAVTARLL